MNKESAISEKRATLRRRADGTHRLQPHELQDIPPGDLQERIHELQAHQIELERQNQELLRITQELERARDEYVELYDRAPVGYFTLTEGGLILQANHTAATMLGTDKAHLVKQRLSAFVLDQDQDTYTLHCHKLFQTRKPQACELRMVRKDGSQFWARVEAASALDCQGQATCRATLSDITERIQAERALQESEERMRLALEATSEGLWDNNFGRKPDYFNTRMYTMLGYEPVDPAKGSEFFRSLLHPQDVGKLDAMVHSLMEPGHDDCTLQFRLRAKDGSWRHILSRGKCIERDDRGQVTRMLGTHLDITAHKLAVEALQESEEKFRVLAEESPNMVFINRRGKVVYANARCEEVIGSKRDEFYAPDFDFLSLIAPEHHDRIGLAFEKHVRGHEVEPFEYTLVTKKGGRVEVLHTTRLIDYKGEQAILGILTDITEHRRAEETVRRSLEEATRSRRLLLMLSQAAQAVERARTTDEVYRVVGEQISALGYHATILGLNPERTHLVLSHQTFGPAMVRAAEKLTGLTAQGYCFRLKPYGLFQQVIETGEAVFTHDDDRPFFEAMPEPLFPLAKRLRKLLDSQQSIIAPLVVDGQVHSLLMVTATGLTDTDLPAIIGFANQAAIALENAKLLATVTEQKRELQSLSTRLIKAQEEERARISRELHDEIGQALAAMNINVAVIKEHLSPELASQIGERLAETGMLVQQTSGRISAMALDLRPSLLDDLGLTSALRWYVSRYTGRLGINVQVETVGLEERLDPEVETALYRLVQEALTNVARHARATHVHLRLERKASLVAATIEDNGQGFDTVELASRQALERGAGLVGMQERIALLGGSFYLQTNPGEGVRLSVEIPL